MDTADKSRAALHKFLQPAVCAGHQDNIARAAAALSLMAVQLCCLSALCGRLYASCWLCRPPEDGRCCSKIQARARVKYRALGLFGEHQAFRDPQ